MPGFIGSEKIVTSEYLAKQMKNYDIRREEKLHDSLYEEVPEVPAIPEHYELAEMQDGTTKNSLKIVAVISLNDILPFSNIMKDFFTARTAALLPFFEKR